MVKKYPLTYEEYEKKIINLFLQTYPEDKQETMVNRLDEALKDDPNLIKGLYYIILIYFIIRSQHNIYYTKFII